MNRKEFLKTCSLGCLGLMGTTLLLESCTGTKFLQADLNGSFLEVPTSTYDLESEGKASFRKYVVVQNERLQYPVCVYRVSANEYHALLMQCTHQGTELLVFGDRLQCPAHGSEFDKKGLVQNGPADKSLRTFPVLLENGLIKIDLS